MPRNLWKVKYPCTEQGRWRNVIAKNRKYTQKINSSLYVLIDRLFAYLCMIVIPGTENRKKAMPIKTCIEFCRILSRVAT